jgi:hypothetical glycosyl hydrolase
MNYSKADEWIVMEDRFESQALGKCEAIMCLGNGYIGLRSATEEKYLNEKRDYFVAGTFNKFDEEEVTELPNAADITAIEFFVDGEYFTLEQGTVREYSRQLNLKTGELSRNITWISPKGVELVFRFKRVVSLKELHVTAASVDVTPKNADVQLQIVSGIDGRMSNSGSQHFSDGNKRLYDKRYMQFVQTTTQSRIDFVHTTVLNFKIDGTPAEPDGNIAMDRRKIYKEYRVAVGINQTLHLEKISNVYTSRDRELEQAALADIQKLALAALKESEAKGYQTIAQESADEWERKVWSKTPITIVCDDPYDQLAIRFAQYHLEIMVPDHDNRMNIGAKGFSGEGYKGHTFWDSDIFVLPYFTFTSPEVARKLVEYRYLSLPGAHKKALSNHYEGAQFPWESAWLDDGEVTPVWGAADIVTGLPIKIWSGFIEQHITADVAYGVWQYYMVTGDKQFMKEYGYELLMDTAKFWASRLEYSGEDQLYHINDVVGPDEYKEHVDDNAFTNYMAYWNIGKAIEYYHLLEKEEPQLFDSLCTKLDLKRVYDEWIDRKDKIYLPTPREEDLVVAQDRTYLSLKQVDLTKYKNQTSIGTIYRDYNQEQISHMQVSKQADILMLFFLMENMFSLEVKQANWKYYEAKTLHDSSLSLSTHCVLASDMGEKELAYSLFNRASRIDLGPNMKTSDDGIHSASIGGIWQCVVYGFGGVRMLNGKLRIEPKLPESWHRLEFDIIWQGQRLEVEADESGFTVVNVTGTEPVQFDWNGTTYTVSDQVKIQYA